MVYSEDRDELIEEAIATNSTEIEVAITENHGYSERYDEYYFDVVGSYYTNLEDYVDLKDLLKYGQEKRCNDTSKIVTEPDYDYDDLDEISSDYKEDILEAATTYGKTKVEVFIQALNKSVIIDLTKHYEIVDLIEFYHYSE